MTRAWIKTGRLVLVAWCSALAACSSFDAQWRAAEKSATAPTAIRWEGRWTSTKHAGPGGPEGGRLRAVLVPDAAGSLRATFRANWKLFTSDYTLVLTPTGAPGQFRGTHELPAIFGGTYRYTARIGGGQFTARYDSIYDCGTFNLRQLPVVKDSRPTHSGH
ncbi:MAG: hypothetical protein K8R23_05605 [Chthoniobacter sp.]|nr:hypothetical protein [Chthoniobacter sp.]